MERVALLKEHILNLTDYLGADDVYEVIEDVRERRGMITTLAYKRKKPQYETLTEQGMGFYGLGRYERALECPNEAIRINPNYAKAWNMKGMALAALGKHNEALNCFNKATELVPSYSDAWYNKATSLRELGRNIDADTAFSQAKELGKRESAEKLSGQEQ